MDTREVTAMAYSLGDMLDGIIASARETGIWQRLTLKEQEVFVICALQEYESTIEERSIRQQCCS